MQPPTVNAIRILRTLSEFRRDPLNYLVGAARKHGDVVLFHIADRRFYLINNPDYIRDVLVTHDRNFIKNKGLQKAKDFIGEGLLTSEGELHRRQRSMMRPAFHRQRINEYACTMVDHAVRAGRGWKDNQTFDVFHEMMQLTVSVLFRTLFDSDVEGEIQKIALPLGTQYFTRGTTPFASLFRWLPLPRYRQMERDRQRLDKLIYGLIAERKKEGRDRGDLLSMLIAATDVEGDGKGMSDKQLRDEFLTLFFAGHETVGSALTWTWHELSRNPEVEKRLHAEIDHVLGGRLPTVTDLPQLKFAEMVFAEAMRLYPSLWIIGREAIEDYTIGPYAVPAKSVVLMSPYLTHRDARYFPDPERFDPERWTDQAKAQRPKFSYFPFGGGSRTCIGDQFAWMEGTLVLITLAQKWQLQNVPGTNVRFDRTFTLRPKGGLPMVARMRKKASSVERPYASFKTGSAN
jgi:cytochrome P450